MVRSGAVRLEMFAHSSAVRKRFAVRHCSRTFRMTKWLRKPMPADWLDELRGGAGWGTLGPRLFGRVGAVGPRVLALGGPEAQSLGLSPSHAEIGVQHSGGSAPSNGSVPGSATVKHSGSPGPSHSAMVVA